MTFRSLRTLGLAATVLTLSGCFLIFPKAAPPPELTPEFVAAAEAGTPAVSRETLENGRALFVSSCNGCHNHPDIDAEPAHEWPHIMKEMGAKSKLTEAQTQDVLAFVLAVRNRPGAPVKK